MEIFSHAMPMPSRQHHKKYGLRLSGKKLSSGKCQVKFEARNFSRHKDLYGYLLVDAQVSLKEVVDRICHRLDELKASKDSVHHIHLYSVGQKRRDDSAFIIFEA